MRWEGTWLEQVHLPARREGEPLKVRETPRPRQGELSQCSTQSSGKIRGFHGAWEARQRALEGRQQGASVELEKTSRASASL